MHKYSEKDYRKILICLALYITSLFAANTLGIKKMPFLFDTHLSVAVFSFPIVFIMTDLIGEVYGKKMAKNFVLAGMISLVLFLFYTFISNILPWSTKALWAKDSYNLIFSVSFRMSVASLFAFFISQYQDVFSFFFFKRNVGSKYFWIRSNLSNLWSQFLDTTIFMLIAFGGIYSLPVMIATIVPWWIYKVSMGFLFTPLSYLGLYLLKEKKLKNEN